VFFAGHGVAFGAENYLLPTDTEKPETGEENLVRSEAHAVDALIRRVQARGAAASFFVIDACRDNPFEAVGVRSIGNSRGLARTDVPTGVFVLFSAGIGQTALDRLNAADSSPNSVFTRTLVPLLRQPGLTHLAIAKRVQTEVLALAASVSHLQQPAFYDQINGEVVLKARSEPPGADLPPAATPAAVVVPPVVPVAPAPAQPAVGVYPDSIGPLSSERERALKPKDSFKECETCPEMVVMPAGSFTMGSPPSELARDNDEGPQRLVMFGKPFAVGRFAVTFDEWDACVADGGCNGHRPSDNGWGRGRRPVITVSWVDAKAYVAWLSRVTGRSYRLLSEAEREYVTRAGTSTPFWFGDSISVEQANYGGADAYSSSSTGFRKETVPVGTFRPNPWGLDQVHGNVREWTEDCYNASYAGAPTDGSPWLKGACNRRVLRNGSWVNMAAILRSAFRGNIGSNELRSDTIGFRVARSIRAR